MRELSPRTLFGALCMLVLSAWPCPAQTDSLQASWAGETWVLSSSGASARIETPAGQTLRFDLPAAAEVSSFVALDSGWALAGSLQDPGNADHRRLFLMTGGDTGAPRPLAEPAGQTGPQRRFPVLLADGGKLAGLAWLEGDDVGSFTVRAAAWTGRRFRAPEAVSQPGPGSQIGLTGAVLADGSWLLAWSAFDGVDNEIVWSRRLGGRLDGQWLAARPVSADNAVPDITPAVVATGAGSGGALLAWSRYEEEGYRLRVARFDGGEWRGEHTAGPAGSLYPSWTGADGRLLYFTAAPRGWVAAELDVSGKTVREAIVVAPYAERPSVLPGSGGHLQMRWSQGKEAEAAWRVAQ